MLRKTTLFLLFLVSYIPLFLILAIQNINDRIYDDCGNCLSFSNIIANNLLPLILIIRIRPGMSVFF
jgi:hypothetical protein